MPYPEPHQNTASLKSLALWAFTIAALTFILFSQALDYKFVIFDDDQYVYLNPLIANGFSSAGLKAAWTSFYASYWCPVLWMSYMADISLHGMDPAGFHLSNNILHALNAGLVFILLRIWVGGTLPALIGAAVFAWHPLRVESVAWITERKDVLSMFWGLLALLAYTRNAIKPRALGMVWVGLFMLIGLLSKPSIIVLPALMILLDYWPLNRGDRGLLKLITEKSILWCLSIGIMIITLFAQKTAIVPLSEAPLLERIFHVPATYIFYLWKTVLPVNLTVLYPAVELKMMSVVTTTFAFIAVSLALLTRPKQSPGLAAGWLWFLIALLPVCGLIRSGTVHLADRFMYLPAIGFSIAIAWLTGELIKKYRWHYGLILLLIPGALAVATWKTLPRWEDSLTLFNDAVQKAPHHAAHYNLGNALMLLDMKKEAADHFGYSTQLRPEWPQGYYNLGTTRALLGEHEAAVVALLKASELDPGNAQSLINLGNSYYLSGRPTQAITSYEKALALEPGNPRLYNNLGWLYSTHEDESSRDIQKAENYSRRAVELAPGRPEFHDTLSVILAEQGEFPEAVKEVQIAIEGYEKAGLKKNAAESIRRRTAYRSGAKL